MSDTTNETLAEGEVHTDDASVDSPAEASDAASNDSHELAETPTERTLGHQSSADHEEVSHDLEHEGDVAADFLEELLDIADLDGDIDMDVEGDRAAVSIVGGDLDHLIGRDGEVLNALQELTRLAVHRDTGERSRLMLDIGGFRAQRRSELEVLASESIEKVRESGESVSLRPMSPFERKVVHDAVAAAGLVSESEGADRSRHVVIKPA